MFLSEAQKKFRFGVSWPSRPGMGGLGDRRERKGFWNVVRMHLVVLDGTPNLFSDACHR